MKASPGKHLAEDSQDALLARHCAGMIRRFAFPKDTVLFRRGETRHCAYLIDKGSVHIVGNDEGGPDKLLCALGEGEIFGEMALVDGSPRSATAVTATEAEIFVVPRDALHERIEGLDPIVSLLMSVLIERYRSSRLASESGDAASHYERLPEEILRLRDTREQREMALKEMKLEQELRIGLEKRQFVPALQPIVSLPDLRVAGFEALIRWQHPERGLVMPNDFIPVAERTGVVQNLDRLMLEKACEILPGLQETAGPGAPDLFVSVNLSGINFGTVDVVGTVERTLKSRKTDPSRIHLEITESALVSDPKTAEAALKGLKKLGVSVALDDFGTGYSSLGYLHRFTIDTIKIDRSFVSRLHDGSRTVDIVRAIVGLARNFDLGIVAEGIESEKDVAVLSALGCDMAQGYLFGRPLAVPDAQAFIRKNLAAK